MTNPGRRPLETAAPIRYEPPRIESVLTSEQLARQVHYAGETTA